MKYLCIALIRFYRKFLSPLKRRPTCRFTPTCSAYALEAFQKRGFFAGMILTVTRIFRCNPFCPGGYDPVPLKGLRREKGIGEQKNAYDSGNETPFVFEYDLEYEQDQDDREKEVQNRKKERED